MKRANSTLVFLCCLLGVPLAAKLLPGIVAQVYPSLAAGALLGALHLLLRPVLRIVTAPIGCVTLGLFSFAIDVGMLYLCDRFVAGFSITSVVSAVITALFINAACAAFRR